MSSPSCKSSCMCPWIPFYFFICIYETLFVTSRFVCSVFPIKFWNAQSRGQISSTIARTFHLCHSTILIHQLIVNNRSTTSSTCKNCHLGMNDNRGQGCLTITSWLSLSIRALRNVAGCLTECIKGDSEAFWKIQLPEKTDQSFSAFSILDSFIYESASSLDSSLTSRLAVFTATGYNCSITFLFSNFCYARVHRLGLLNIVAMIWCQGWLRTCMQNDIYSY